MTWNFELVHGPLGRPLSGLAWDGSGMLFSDVNNSSIHRWDPVGRTISTARKYTNRTNGLAFGANGVFYGGQSGSRRIARFMPDGSANVPASRVSGLVHNTPYLLTVDRQERIWFSDPIRRDMISGPGPQRFPFLDHQSVLRLSRDERNVWGVERMTFDTRAPAGVAVSPDGKTLYVAESDNEREGVRELRAYSIADDGTLGTCLVLHTFGSDHRGLHRGIEGLCVDIQGNIIACAGGQSSGPGPLVYIFSPTGAILETHAVPADQPLNCAFGDAGLGSLYVTTTAGHLFRVPSTGRTGYLPFPQGGR